MSRFLVDTQLLLWNAAASRRLPARLGRLFKEGRHEFFASAASLWEVAVKSALGRPDFAVDASRLRDVLLDNGFLELPVSGAHAVAVAGLPPLHADPFDRLIVAQALVEPMVLVTADARLGAYPGNIEVV